MKWPFRRNTDISNVPAEIQEYYQTERRERTGVAWLLALGTLIITIGLATLLFFGGRWLYRTIADRDDDKTDNTSQVEQGPSETATDSGSSDVAQNGSTPAPGNTGTSSTNTENGSTQGTQNTPPTPTPRATTPVTGDSLPDTGPGDIVGMFTATTVTAATIHYAVSSRRRI